MCKIMAVNCKSDQSRMLCDIGMVSFAVVELTLYLDTHPRDKEAMEYFNHYNRIQNQLTKDYAAKYGPLNLSVADNYNKEWQWALQPMPWEGVV